MSGSQLPPPRELRSCIEADSYQESARKIVGQDVRRLDELTDAVQWKIIRSPESCPVVPNTPLRVAKAQVPGEHTIVRVYFTWDAPGSCTLRWIEAEEVQEDFSDDDSNSESPVDSN